MPNYSGIWTEQAVMQAVGAGNWPGNPGAPTIGTATAGDASASVTFTAPTNNGGSAITSYTVTSSPGSLTGTGASSPITVSGLTNGTAYTFTVTATNATGTGPASAASNSVTPALPNYIEEVFSTWLYNGTGSAQTITNGIDFSTNGGLLWLKARNDTRNNWLYDTTRSIANGLRSDSVGAQTSTPDALTAFNSNGFSIGSSGNINTAGNTLVSWSFQKQAKFFDVVTWTGDDASSRTIAHNLGSVPGFIVVKDLGGNQPWPCYHRSLGATKGIYLAYTNASEVFSGLWNNTEPTSTQFTVGQYNNSAGATYVAYLFAHDAGGFGLTGTDNVISCGSFTTNSSGQATVTLGYEPQWLLMKNSSGTADSWVILDNMRGWNTSTNEAALFPNSSSAESGGDYGTPNATGFTVANMGNTKDFIYVAIRRGPMKVPTSGTSVFSPIVATSGTGTTNFPVDMQILSDKGSTNAILNQQFVDRLRGVSSTTTAQGNYLLSSSTAAESSTYPNSSKLWSNTGFGIPSNYEGASSLYLSFRRAPSFFDEVCWSGAGANLVINHNLQAVPELIINKYRNGTSYGWATTAAGLVNPNTNYLTLNSSNAEANSGASPGFIYDRTSTTFTVSSDLAQAGFNWVSYLFATCAGVSKVGSYTGTGALQTVNCGFAAGARFVLIKRTDSTGDWWTYDSARGITSGNDPYLYLNTTAAEVTNTNYVDTTAVGFQVTAAAPAGLNASGGTYIFLAIA
jgi:hypothetical protein